MTPNSSKPPRTLLLRSTILCMVLGIALLAVVAVSNARYNPRVVTIPLVFSQPGTFDADFKTELDTEHELHIEVLWEPPQEVRSAMGIVEGPSDIDLSWVVSQEDTEVARGDARWYTFVGYNTDWRIRLIDKLFWMAPHEQLTTDTLSRGIGAFHAQAGARYHLAATVNTPLPIMDQVQPRLAVQIGRRFWMRHTSRTLPLGYAGLGCLMLGGVSLACWLLMALQAMRRRGSGVSRDA